MLVGGLERELLQSLSSIANAEIVLLLSTILQLLLSGFVESAMCIELTEGASRVKFVDERREGGGELGDIAGLNGEVDRGLVGCTLRQKKLLWERRTTVGTLDGKVIVTSSGNDALSELSCASMLSHAVRSAAMKGANARNSSKMFCSSSRWGLS